MSRFEVFTKFPLFQGLSIDDLLSILAKVSLDFEKYTSGDTIGKAGEANQGLLLLMDGEASIGGNTVKAPAMLEYSHLFGQSQVFPKDITAESDCSTLCISSSSLIELLQSNKVVLTNYLTLLSDRIES